MENNTTTKKASNYNELLMHHNMLFTDSLKDLKSLSKQLYSAAEYFEQSYSKQSQQQVVVGNLKEYVNNAIISTVDHLGSVAYKMNEFLDEKVNEVSTAELHVTCFEQRLKTVQKFIDWSGFSQESFVINTPKHHKQYTIPGGEQDTGKFKVSNCSPLVEKDLNQCKKAFLATQVKPHSPSNRHRKSPSMPKSSPRPETFSFARIGPGKPLEKRSVSPLRSLLKHSGSSNGRQQVMNMKALELNRSISLKPQAEKDMRKEIQLYSKKNKPLLKSLLTMYKYKKDGRP